MDLAEVKRVLLILALSNNDKDKIVAQLGHDWAHVGFRAYVAAEAVTGDFAKDVWTIESKAARTLELIANYEAQVDRDIRGSDAEHC